VPVRRLPELSATEKIGPRLTELAEASASGRVVSVLADLPVQVDLAALGREMTAAALPRAQRAERVRQALAAIAGRRQAALESILGAWQARGIVRSWRGVRIVNRLILEVPVGALPELAGSPAIARLWDGERPRPLQGLPRPVSLSAGGWPKELRRQNWALETLGLARLWRRRHHGRGVVVGILDSGVDGRHPQLAPNWRRDDGWFDPVAGRAEPWDSAGHGTAVLGCAVARNREGYRIGVAPRAGWVAALANPEGLFHLRHFTDAADWMLFDARPDVLLMAFGFETGACDDTLRPFVEAFRAAEIFTVFAAGNEGPEPGTDISPANYAGLAPDGGAAFSVGGLERDLGSYPRSSTGPASCGGRVYPTAVAPAAGLPILLAKEPLYDWSQGTSYAAGYAAGIAALLYEERPELLVSEIEAALTASARDLGPAGADHRFGHGLLHPAAALDRLRGRRPAR
jgi:bacillopeptidase F